MFIWKDDLDEDRKAATHERVGTLADAAGVERLTLGTGVGSLRTDYDWILDVQLADRAAAQFTEAIATFRAAAGDDPAVAAVWSYGLVGALHFVTLWWLRDQPADLDTTSEQLVDLLWAGLAGGEANRGRKNT